MKSPSMRGKVAGTFGTACWCLVVWAAAAAATTEKGASDAGQASDGSSSKQLLQSASLICDGTLRELVFPQPPYPIPPATTPTTLPQGFSCVRPNGGKCGAQARVQCAPYTMGPVNQAAGNGVSLQLPPTNPLLFAIDPASNKRLTYINWTAVNVGTGGALLVGFYPYGGGEERVAHQWVTPGSQRGTNNTVFCGPCSNCEIGKGIKSMALAATKGPGFTGFALSQLHTDVRCGNSCFDMDASYWTGMQYICVGDQPTCSDINPSQPGAPVEFACPIDYQFNPAAADITPPSVQSCCLRRTCAAPNPASQPSVPFNCAQFSYPPAGSQPGRNCTLKPNAGSQYPPSQSACCNCVDYFPSIGADVSVSKNVQPSAKKKAAEHLATDDSVSAASAIGPEAPPAEAEAQQEAAAGEESAAAAAASPQALAGPRPSSGISLPLPSGSIFTFVLRVKMEGLQGDVANNVRLSDTMPAGLTIVSVTYDPGCTWTPSTLTCVWSSLTFADSTRIITVQARSTQAGTFLNCAAVLTSSNDPNLGNNQDCATAISLPTCGDTSSSLNGMQQFNCIPNSQFEFNPLAVNNTIISTDSCCLRRTCSAPNPGSQPGVPFNCAAFNVAPQPGVPGQACTPLPNPSPTQAPSVTSCCDCVVINQQTGDVSITKTVAPLTKKKRKSSAAAEGSDAAATAVPSEVAVQSGVSAPRPVGFVFTFTLTIQFSCLAGAVADNVRMSDTLPAGLTIDSISGSTGSCSLTPDRSTLTCNFGQLTTTDSTRILTVNARATRAGTWQNCATVTTSSADADPTNNQDCAVAVVQGACCTTSGSSTACQNTLPAQCSQTFYADQPCSANPCGAQQAGACCVASTGACSYPSTATACASAGGAFSPGLTCSQITCGTSSTGACCILSQNRCLNSQTASACSNQGGSFYSGLSCSQLQCSSTPANGACCLYLQSLCLDGQTNTGCITAGGLFFANTPCSQVQCAGIPPATGACCLPGSNQCLNAQTPGACAAAAGTFFVGLSCSQVTCSPAPTGACCILSQNRCVEAQTAAGCSNQGGSFFQGLSCNQITCSNVPGSGACCLANLQPPQCLNGQSQSGCLTAGGSFYGGATCSQVTCPGVPATGACCIASQNRCLDGQASSSCATQGGAFYQGLACSQISCTSSPSSGACCLTGNPNQCLNGQTSSGCALAGGSFWNNATCATVQGFCFTPGTGACCIRSGGQSTCREGQTSSTCASAGGQFYQAQTCSQIQSVCGTSPSSGACCLKMQGMCLDGSSTFACASQGGTFYPGSKCSSIQDVCPPNVLGACCSSASGACVDNIPQSLCPASTGSWVANKTCGVAGFCMGACCDIDTTQCTQTVKADCANSNNRWQLYTSCATADCSGVKCVPDWYECDPRIPFQCCPGSTCQWTAPSLCIGLYTCKPQPVDQCVGKGEVCGGKSGSCCCKGLCCVWDEVNSRGTCQPSAYCLPPGSKCSSTSSSYVCPGNRCVNGTVVSAPVTAAMCTMECSDYSCYQERETNCNYYYAAAASEAQPAPKQG